MQFKTFTRLFLLLGMIGLISVSSFAQERGETVTKVEIPFYFMLLTGGGRDRCRFFGNQ
mgnify:CR=1 FL=1